MAANATFALKPGVWFLRVRFVIFAPDSRREPSPPSGRKSTQPTVQILKASSESCSDDRDQLCGYGYHPYGYHSGYGYGHHLYGYHGGYGTRHYVHGG